MSEGKEVAKTVDDSAQRVPGYCSAVVVTRDALMNEIKKPEIKTSDIYATCNLPKRFEHPLYGVGKRTACWVTEYRNSMLDWFNGYGSQVSKQHPFYRTTASEYGWYPPGYHSVPSVYHPLDTQFAESMIRAGMYRNYSLNMSAPDPPTKMC